MNCRKAIQKKRNIFLILLFIVSAWSSFNAIYFDWFIKSLILFLAAIFAIFFLSNKYKGKIVIFISVVLILAVILGNLFINFMGSCLFAGGYKVSLVTNTITDKCIISIDNCRPRQVWYHENGCDIAKEGKENIISKIKEDIRYDKISDYCMESCNEKINDIPENFQELEIRSYCDLTYSYALPDGFSCNDLDKCPYIDCASYLIKKNELDVRKEFVCANSQECVDIGWECDSSTDRVPTCYTHNARGPIENPKCYCMESNLDW